MIKLNKGGIKVKKISDTFIINKKEVKNRVLMAPVVCFNWTDEEGIQTVDRSKHYGMRAQGGAGIIVIEATSICSEGRIIEKNLGLWNDNQIAQFKKMADSIREHNSISLVQLVHAGDKSFGSVKYSPYPNSDEQTYIDENYIDKIISDYVESAKRAYKAGLDGIEIHGAHGYLISQFTTSYNKRDDKWGGSLENRNRLALSIVEAIRKELPSDFIIGYRFGVNDSTFKDDIVLASLLEEYGVDLLNVSVGILDKKLSVPNDYPYSIVSYAGVYMKNHVNIPVGAVGLINSSEIATDLVENYNVDFIAVARAVLADCNFGNKLINGEKINKCYACKPRCKFGVDGKECPWYETNNI